MLLDYFTKGTEKTKTGASIGFEIETDFVRADGSPISVETSAKLLSATSGRPRGCQQKLELGRQKIELSLDPQPTGQLAIEVALEALDWLYGQAAQEQAYPLHAPHMNWPGQLLWVQDPRDAVWVELDGLASLEQLCRCSSVQLTVSLNPNQALEVLNTLHQAKLDQYDYAPNHQRWLTYISLSHADYIPNRYAGPTGFDSLQDYVAQLERHLVVMDNGQPSWQPIHQLKNPDIDLFLRSIWWHYRLRRYGQTLAVEIRPFARRTDQSLAAIWQLVSNTLGLD